MKKKILIYNKFYLPGEKSGGPINSINNLINKVFKPNSKEFDIYFICNDRDFLDKNKYPNIKQNKINQVNGIKIIYVSNILSLILWTLKLKNVNKFYLNSFFDFNFSILPFLILRFLSRGSFIINPRGELSIESLEIKKNKKFFYLYICKFFRFYNKCLFQISDNSEVEIIKKFVSNKIIIVANLVEILNKAHFKRNLKEKNLKLIYFSRITKKKNLFETLKILKKFQKNFVFDIYGTIDDPIYWNKCKAIIDQINSSKLKVFYKGVFKRNNLNSILNKYHFSILLSEHENFGHSIVDSLINYTPVITTQNVYWKELENYNIGWNIEEISNHDFVLKILNKCYDNKNNFNLDRYKQNLTKYLKVYYKEDQLISKYFNIFNE